MIDHIFNSTGSSFSTATPEQRGRILSTSGATGTEMTPEMVDAELEGIPPPTLAKLKRKCGMAGKDLASMTLGQKMRLVHLSRLGTMRPRIPPGHNTMPAGPQQQQHAQPTVPPPPLQTGPVTRPQNILPVSMLLNDDGAQPRTHSSWPPMSSNYNSMPGHGSVTPVQHPMAPSVMQPGPGRVDAQLMHQYRQAMQNIHTSHVDPQHTMPSGAPSGGMPGLFTSLPFGSPLGAPPHNAHIGVPSTTAPPATHTSSAGGSALPAPMPNLSTPRLPGPNPNPQRLDMDTFPVLSLKERTDEILRELNLDSVSEDWNAGWQRWSQA